MNGTGTKTALERDYSLLEDKNPDGVLFCNRTYFSWLPAVRIITSFKLPFHFIYKSIVC